MFNKSNKTDNQHSRPNDNNNNGSVNLIGAGTTIEGDVKSNGDIRIDGTVYGSITSKAKIVVGITGIIEGDVFSANADVSGAIKGKTTVSDLLFLKSSAKITGDIITGKLVVDVGASFTGSCSMGPVIKDIKHGDKSIIESRQEKTA